MNWDKARAFAKRAHKGQKRWDGEPFVTHPEAVATVIGEDYGYDSFEAQAAWLHDVVEDTNLTFQDLAFAGFDNQVIGIVSYLTKREGEAYLDYVRRVALQDEAREIKIADLTHNLSTSDDGKHKSLRDKWELAKFILESLD